MKIKTQTMGFTEAVVLVTASAAIIMHGPASMVSNSFRIDGKNLPSLHNNSNFSKLTLNFLIASGYVAKIDLLPAACDSCSASIPAPSEAEITLSRGTAITSM
jgi:hypothetical protein